MTRTDLIDATRGERPGDVRMRLDCTRCERMTKPARKRDEPSTIVRCYACGKKHSHDSVTILDP